MGDLIERLEEVALRFGRAPAHAYTLEAAPLLREAAEHIRALNALVDFERAARHNTDLKLGEVLGRKS